MRATLPSRQRTGFTAVELLIVCAVLILLAGMSLPALLTALRKAEVNEAVAMLEHAHVAAHVLARETTPTASGYFRLRLHGDQRPVTVEVLDPGGDAVETLHFNRNVRVLRGGQAPGSSLEWSYDWGSGHVLDGRGNPTAIGAGADPDLLIATQDGRIARRVAVFEVGLLHSEEP